MTGLWFLLSAISYMPSITVSSFIYLSSILLEIFSDKLTIAKIRRDITLYFTCDRVIVLVLCTFSDGRLSMHQILFNSLAYFKRHAPDKL